jgi:phosphate uptake regulator
MYQTRRPELRRLQRSGGSLVISLPHAWARALGLKKGDALEVVAEGRALLLRPWGKGERGRRQISLSYRPGQDRAFFNELVAAYLDGYTDIRVSAHGGLSPTARQMIRNLTSKLLGLEVVEENSEVQLRVMADASGLAPEQALRRMHVSTQRMKEWAVAGLLGRREEALRAVEEDEVVDRLYFYLVRLLRAAAFDAGLAVSLDLSPLKLLDFRVASQLLESIGDKAVALARERPLPSPSALEASLAELTKLLTRGQEQAFSAFLSRDMGATIAVHELHEQVKKLAGSLLASPGAAPELAVACSLMLDMAGLWTDLADLAGPLRE